MELIKAIHVDDLKEIQEEAERYLFNRSVPDVLLSGLEDGIEWLPVSFSMNHTRMKLPGDPDFDEPHVRVLVVYSRDGKKAQLDITTKRFNKLQTVGVSTPDDGEVKDAT